MTEIELEWIIMWFPPEGDCKRKFRNEQAARRYAATEVVAKWNPLMEKITKSVTSELVPL